MNVMVEREKHEYELTKEFNRMSKTAQAQLTEKYKADVELGINVHFAKLQKHWLILDCIVDHDIEYINYRENIIRKRIKEKNEKNRS